MFKPFTIKLRRVHDKVAITNGETTLTLTVDATPEKLVSGLLAARRKMQALGPESTTEEMLDAARDVAAAIFGAEQARKLLEYYHDDPGCVVTVCAKYFTDRLRDKITRAQKKRKP
jgi:hypothetical protein